MLQAVFYPGLRKAKEIFKAMTSNMKPGSLLLTRCQGRLIPGIMHLASSFNASGSFAGGQLAVSRLLSGAMCSVLES